MLPVEQIPLSAEQEAAVDAIVAGRNVILSGRSSCGKRTVCCRAAQKLPRFHFYHLSEGNSSAVRGKAASTVLVIETSKFNGAAHILNVLSSISSSPQPFGGFRIIVVHDDDYALSLSLTCDGLARADTSCTRIILKEPFHNDARCQQILAFIDGMGDSVPSSYGKGPSLYEDVGTHQVLITNRSGDAARLNRIANAVVMEKNGYQTYHSLVNETFLTLEWTPTYILANPEGTSTAEELKMGLANSNTFQSISFVLFPWITDNGSEHLAFRVEKKHARRLEEALSMLDRCGWKVVNEINREWSRLDCVPMVPVSIRLAVGSKVSSWSREQKRLRPATVVGFEQSTVSITGWASNTLWPRVRYWDDKSERVVLPDIRALSSPHHYKVHYAGLPLRLSFAVAFKHMKYLPKEASPHFNPQWFLNEPNKFRYMVARTPSWYALKLVGGTPPYALFRRRLSSLIP